jgi:hypothetical protein
MFVQKEGLTAIAKTAADAREAVERAYTQHLRDLEHWDDPKHRAKFTAAHIQGERTRIKAEYQSKVRSLVAATEAARQNLQRAAAERSPAELLKVALQPAAPPDVAAATLVELRTARLREDAKAASGPELAQMVAEATEAHDLHRVALIEREISRRDRQAEWPLTDSGRVRAKIAIDAALDRIESFVPGRSEEVATIESAAQHFHIADEYQRATISGGEPLPVAMARAEQRRKAAAPEAPPAGPGDATMISSAG